MTMVRELRNLSATNKLGVRLKGTILGHELRAPDAMNSLGLRMT